jgi:hypothetical protein
MSRHQASPPVMRTEGRVYWNALRNAIRRTASWRSEARNADTTAAFAAPASSPPRAGAFAGRRRSHELDQANAHASSTVSRDASTRAARGLLRVSEGAPFESSSAVHTSPDKDQAARHSYPAIRVHVVVNGCPSAWRLAEMAPSAGRPLLLRRGRTHLWDTVRS